MSRAPHAGHQEPQEGAKTASAPPLPADLTAPSSASVPFQAPPAPQAERLRAADAQPIDPRLLMGREVAKRGLAFGSSNDSAKALLLLFDYLLHPDATQTEVGQA